MEYLVWALAISHFSPDREACSTPPVAVAVGAFVISSYFLLFVHFYFMTYIKTAKNPTGQEVPSKGGVLLMFWIGLHPHMFSFSLLA
jgi:hypothetical protein